MILRKYFLPFEKKNDVLIVVKKKKMKKEQIKFKFFVSLCRKI